MAQVYFLVPGLIPGPSAKDRISGATIDRLRKTIGRLSDDPVLQPLGSSVFAKSVHLSWMWSVLTRRALPFTSAPYTWAVQNGPMLSGDIWSLTLSNRRKDGSLAPANLSHDDMEAACAALTPVLLDMGFVLQRWDPHLYLTRKKKLEASAVPFEVLQTQNADPETWIEGTEKSELIKLLGACETALTTIGSPAQTVWLTGGGGAFDYVYPPTKIRSVLTDNEAVKGWALAAGILLQRIGNVTGATTWLEDAPQGECIALIEDLYEPWLKQDWQTWEAHIPKVCERIDVLSAASKKKGCDAALIVGTGEGFTVSCPKQLSSARSFLARLTGSDMNPASILFLENAS